MKPSVTRRAVSLDVDDAPLRVRPLRRPLAQVASPQKEHLLPANVGEVKTRNIRKNILLKHGHSLTFLGLFTFTFLVYFRPYELFSSLSWLSRGALVVALATLAVYVPTQLGLENTITSRLREVKLALLLLSFGLLSVPLALEPARAFQSFLEYLKVIVIFVVTVNVVRT